MRMVFEIYSLKNATPATVSRAGILYINEADIGWGPMVESWINTRTDPSEKGHLPTLFDKHTQTLIDLVKSMKMETLTPISTMARCTMLCRMLEGLLDSIPVEGRSAERVEQMYLFAAMWAFGGAATADRNADFRTQFSSAFKAAFPQIKFPPKGSLCFDYYVDPASGELLKWAERVPEYNAAAQTGGFASIIVPTADLVRLTYYTTMLVDRGHPVMFCGAAGTGKTTLVRQFLGETVNTRRSTPPAASAAAGLLLSACPFANPTAQAGLGKSALGFDLDELLYRLRRATAPTRDADR